MVTVVFTTFVPVFFSSGQNFRDIELTFCIFSLSYPLLAAKFEKSGLKNSFPCITFL